MKKTTLFSNLKIRTKLLVLSFIMLFFIVIILSLQIYESIISNENNLKSVEQTITTNYDLNIKNQVENVIAQLNVVYSEYELGVINLDRAKQISSELIRDLRYGDDNDYFWVDTTEGLNVVLYGSSIEGTNRYYYKDMKGNFVVQEFINKALAGKGEYTDYWFPRPGKTQAVRKRGYTVLFKPFNWVIGTGNYIDDIDKIIVEKNKIQNNEFRKKITIYAIICFLFTGSSFVSIFMISKNISVPLREAVNKAIQISNGVLEISVSEDIKKRKDEVGELSVALEKMKNAIKELIDNLTNKADDLEKGKELLRTTLMSVGDGIITSDEHGNISLINPVAEKLTGYTQKDAFVKPFEEIFNILNENTRQQCVNPVKKVLELGENIELDSDTILISQTGMEIPIEYSAAPIINENGKTIGSVLVFRDVTDKKKRNKKIEYLSYHDQLTGLYNRRFFEEQLETIDTKKNYPLSIIMSDVNGLKLTNDAYGHSVGDKLIKKAAEIMKTECRAEDIVARIGGDEFAILLTKTGLEEAQFLITRMRQRIDAEKVESVNLSISLGCAQKTSSIFSMSKLMQKAEGNMYKQKLLESETVKKKIIYTIKEQMSDVLGISKKTNVEISKMCVKIGEIMNMDSRDIFELKTAASMNDIGEMTLNKSILYKNEELTDTEWAEIKHHPEAGYHILKSLNELVRVSEYVLAHHERWDGTGYPKELKEDQIPLASRIIFVVVAYFAMISEKPYRKTRTNEEAVKEIIINSGTQFDPSVVTAFLKCHQECNSLINY